MPEHPDPQSVEPSTAFNHLVSIRSEVQSAIAKRRYSEAQEICDDGLEWAQDVTDWSREGRTAFIAVATQQMALMVDSVTLRMVNNGDFNQVRGNLYEAAATMNKLADSLPMAALQCGHYRPSLDGVWCISENPCPPDE